MRSLQSQERSKKNEKRSYRKSSKDSPLKAQRFPQYVSVAERPEPQHVDVIRQRGPTAEKENGKDGENEEKEAAATPWRVRSRPVNGLHCSTPFLLAFLLSQLASTLAKPYRPIYSPRASSETSRRPGSRSRTAISFMNCLGFAQAPCVLLRTLWSGTFAW